METDDWIYEIEILNIADINRDNILDLEVCFRDKSKTATYNAQQPMLLSQLEKMVPWSLSIFRSLAAKNLPIKPASKVFDLL